MYHLNKPFYLYVYFTFLNVGSEIYEDPAVMYEGVAENPEPISIDTYLVPYNKDFSLGFIHGEQAKKTEEEKKEEQVNTETT